MSREKSTEKSTCCNKDSIQILNELLKKRQKKSDNVTIVVTLARIFSILHFDIAPVHWFFFASVHGRSSWQNHLT